MFFKNVQHKYAIFVFGLSAVSILAAAQVPFNARVVFVDSAWSANSVNTVIFRKNALCTFKNLQYISYYNNSGDVMLGKRKTGSSKWQLYNTGFKGDVRDAHRSISIITDGDGFLHLSWNHHGNKLHYSKSKAPGSLKMEPEQSMTGIAERNVTYPEFYVLPGGDLFFLYRDGSSGKGNLVLNRYAVKTKQWQQLHSNLIDGEGSRNAYWQACVDTRGTIHISWVWRESPDVASNHDMCYAKSADGGVTWTNSKNEKYVIPVNAATAEYISRIPQKSELINQTSMFADESGNPFIASYWKEAGDSIPQYHVVYNVNGVWITKNTGFRKTAFTLSGAGTKRIPISRPQIISFKKNNRQAIAIIFRDAERGSKVSVALCNNIEKNQWQLSNLLDEYVGSWEPVYDTELWKKKQWLHLFVQHTEQADGEGRTNTIPQPIKVLEIKF